MRRNWLFALVAWLFSFFQKVEERAYADRARRRAWQRHHDIGEAAASGLFGEGRLADECDAEEFGLFGRGGLWLGSFAGRVIYWHGEGHILSYVMTGGGKGVCYVIPNLCFINDRTLIITDGKDGENAWATYKHRAENLGSKVVLINPDGLHGLPTARLNPFKIVIDKVASGARLESEAQELVQILLPSRGKDDKNAWVRNGAVRLAYTWAEWAALYHPTTCTLSGLWRFINADKDTFELMLSIMAECDHEGVAGRAKSLLATYQNAAEQFEAYKSDCVDALTAFEPGKAYADATSAHDFDFSQIKKTTHTIYIMSASNKLEIAAPFIGLVTHYLIEIAARAKGPYGVTFLLDEFPQIPPVPAIPKALKLYRAKSIQLWIFSQGRHSLAEKWGKSAVADFEDQAAVFTMAYVIDPTLIKDLGIWSGRTSIMSQQASYSGGTVESANLSSQEQGRELLQPEQVARLTVDDGQIIKIRKIAYLFAARMEPFYKVREFRDVVADTRKLHSGEA